MKCKHAIYSLILLRYHYNVKFSKKTITFGQPNLGLPPENILWFLFILQTENGRLLVEFVQRLAF